MAQPVRAVVLTFNLELLQVDTDDVECHNADDNDDDPEGWIADVHGGALPAVLVIAARKKEIKYLLDRKAYSYATEAEAWIKVRRKPIKLKWIDSNKGDTREYRIRSRLVCTEIRRKGMEAIFLLHLHWRPYGFCWQS